MLPTKEKAKIGMINLEPLNREGFKLELIHYVINGDGLNPQHLYITSDEEIKEGDWVITTISELDIYNQIEIFENKCDSMYCKKIIATTNNSLMENYELMSKSGLAQIQKILPQPSQSFIEKYITEYNKGNVIIDVLVEYEAIGNWRHAAFVHTRDIPKVSKDNTITIKKVKDSWTKEELVQILSEFGKDVVNKESHLPHMFELYAIDWIEENL